MLIFSFLFSYPGQALATESFLDYDRELAEATKEKEYAFRLVPEYHKVLTGKGYVPSLHFRSIRWKYTYAIRQYPNNPFLPYCVGELYRYGNKYEDAVKFYDSAVERAGPNLFKHTLLLDLFSKRKLLQWQRKEEGQFLELKKDFGARSLPIMSTYFFARARKSVKEGIDNGIENNVRIARELDPYNPAVQLFYIRFLLLHKRFEFFDEAFRFLHTIFIDFQMRLYAVVFLFNFLFLILIIVLSGFIIAHFVKYFPFIVSKALIITPRRIPMNIRYFFIITILIIPLIWTIPSIYALVYMLILPIAFRERKEKWSIQFLILLLFIMSLLGYVQTKAYSALDPTSKVMLKERIQKSRYEPYLVSKCDDLIKKYPKDFSGHFLKALQLKRGGFLEESEENYRKAIEYGTAYPQNYNNLGNVLFWKGEIDNSIEYYSLAMQYDPQIAAAHYNIAQAYVRKLVFDKSSQHMKIASQLDFDLISKKNKEAIEKNNRFLLDMMLPYETLWTDLLSSESDNDVFPWKFIGLNYRIFSILLLCFFAINIIIPRLFKNNRMRCPFCFSPISRANSMLFDKETICWRCYKKLNKIHSLDVQERLKDKIEMDAKQRVSYTSTFWGLFIPGIGHFQLGRIRSGSMFLLVFAVLCSLLVINTVTELSQNLVFPGQSNLKFYIILALIVVNYLFSLLSLFSINYEDGKQ